MSTENKYCIWFALKSLQTSQVHLNIFFAFNTKKNMPLAMEWTRNHLQNVQVVLSNYLYDKCQMHKKTNGMILQESS